MRNRGFSLVELMITIAVLAAMIAIAYPNFAGTLRGNRLAGSTNEMIASLALARSEAARSTRGSGICASQDGLVCGGAWSDGWIVWVEGADSPGPDYDAASDQIVRHVGGRGNLQVSAQKVEDDADEDATFVADQTADAVAAVRFDGRGRPVASDLPVTWYLLPAGCRSGDLLVRRISMTLAGQIRNIRGACGEST